MRITTLLLVAFVALQPSTGLAAGQRNISSTEERTGWREAARAMPPGVTVKVELIGGRRVTGTLMVASDEGLLIKERTRRARPAVMIAMDDVARIERVNKDGGSIVKAIAAGAAAGVGGFLTFLAIALMITD